MKAYYIYYVKEIQLDATGKITADKLYILKRLLELLNHYDENIQELPIILLYHLPLYLYVNILVTVVNNTTDIKPLLSKYKPDEIIKAFNIVDLDPNAFQNLFEKSHVIYFHENTLRFCLINNITNTIRIDLNESYKQVEMHCRDMLTHATAMQAGVDDADDHNRLLRHFKAAVVIAKQQFENQHNSSIPLTKMLSADIAAGRFKAVRLYQKIQECSTLEAALLLLKNHWELDSNIRFDEHSFDSYLLRAFTEQTTVQKFFQLHNYAFANERERQLACDAIKAKLEIVCTGHHLPVLQGVCKR